MTDNVLRTLDITLIGILMILVRLAGLELSHIPKVLGVIDEVSLALVDLILELAVGRILVVSTIGDWSPTA